MTMSDYSDLEQEIKDAPEPTILPAKTEVKARVISVESGVSDKNDAQWYNVVYDVPSEPLALPFRDFFWDLNDKNKLSEKQYQMALPHFRKFAECFRLDYSRPFSWKDDLPGLEGWVELKVIKDKSGEYPDKNGVAKYITGPREDRGEPIVIPDDDIPF